MKINLIVLLIFSSSFASANQWDCKYWIDYFRQIGKYEQAVIKATQRGDMETARRYKLLIKRDMQDINDDTEESEQE